MPRFCSKLVIFMLICTMILNGFPVYSSLGAEDAQAPSAPVGLSASDTSAFATTLSWLESTDDTAVVGYEVYEDGELLGTVTGATYQVSGLTAHTTYRFSVRAKDAAGHRSNPSDPLEVSTLDGGNLLTNPGFEDETNGWFAYDETGSGSSVVGDNVWEGRHALRMQVAASGDQYVNHVVDMGTDVAGHVYTFSAYVKTSGISGTGVVLASYWQDAAGGLIWQNNVVSQAVSGTTDWTRLSVVSAAPAGAQKLMLIVYPADRNGQGEFWLDQAAIMEEADTQAPSAPVNLIASNVTETTVDLGWTAAVDNVGVVSYDVYGDGALVGSTTNTGYTVSGLAPGSVHRYTVKARDAAGNLSEPSAELGVETSWGEANLLRNGSFELFTAGDAAGESWSSIVAPGAAGDNRVVSSPTVAGSYAQRVAGNGIEDGGVSMVRQSVPVAGGRLYTLSGQFAIESLQNAKVQLYVDFYDAADQYVGANAVEALESNVGYQLLQVSGTTPVDATRMQVYAILRGVGGNGSGAFTVDAMTFALETAAGDTQAPSAPVNLIASNVTETTVDLSWTAATDNVGVVSYDVYGDGALIGSTTNTGYTVSGLAPGSVHRYTVKAWDAAGNLSEPSAELGVETSWGEANLLRNGSFELFTARDAAGESWSLIVTQGVAGDNRVMSSPTVAGSYAQRVAGSGIEDGGVSMVRQSVPVAGGRLYTLSGQFAIESLQNAKVQLYVDFYDAADQYVGANAVEALEPGTGYQLLQVSGTTPVDATRMQVYAILRGVGGNGSGAFTVDAMTFALETAAADTQAPSAPVNLIASNVTETTVDLGWTAAADNVGVVSYDVYGDGALAGSTTNTGYTVSGLAPGSVHRYTVKARDAAGNLSEPSAELGVETSWGEANLLRNGSFELFTAGDAAGASWSSIVTPGAAGDNRVMSSPTVAGSYAQRVAGSGIEDGGVSMVRQSVPVAGGRLYTLSGQFAIESLQNAKVQLYVDFYDAADQYVGANAVEALEPGTGYQLLQVSGTTPVDATRMQVYAILRGVGGNGNGAFTVDAMTFALETAVEDTQAPNAPMNLIASNVTETTVDLSWTAATDDVGVVGYDVYNVETWVGSTTGETQFKATGLLYGSTYRFTVKAKDAAGNVSAASNVLEFSPADEQAPTSPFGLSASDITGISVKLIWQSASDNVGVVSYDVYADQALVGTTSNVTFDVYGLTSSYVYTFTVKAKDAVGNVSLPSESLAVTTLDVVPPTVPTGLAVSGVTFTAFTLNWQASFDNAGVVGYELYVDGTYITFTTGLSYTFNDLVPGQSYLLEVQAKDAAGNLSDAAQINASPQSDAPLNLLAANITETQTTLSWQPSGYGKQIVGYDFFKNGAYVTTVFVPKYTVSNLTAGSLYTFSVKAKYASGESSAEAVIAVKTAYPSLNGSQSVTIPAEGFAVFNVTMDAYRTYRYVAENGGAQLQLLSHADNEADSLLESGSGSVQYIPSNAGNYFLKIYGLPGSTVAVTMANGKAAGGNAFLAVDKLEQLSEQNFYAIPASSLGYYTVYLNADTEYLIATTSSTNTSLSSMSIYDKNSIYLFQVMGSTVVYKPTYSGVHYIRLSNSYQNGKYRVIAIPAVYGKQKTGTIDRFDPETNTYYTLYSVNLRANTTFTFIRQDGNASLVHVYDNMGTEISWDSDGNLTRSTGGIYFVQVIGSQLGETFGIRQVVDGSDYSMSYAATEDVADLGSKSFYTVDANHTIYYSVQLQQGKKYVIGYESTAVPTSQNMDIYNSDFNYVGHAYTNRSILFEAPYSGTYYISISNHNQVAKYSLIVAPSSYGLSKTGVIDHEDITHHFYTVYGVNLEANRTFSFAKQDGGSSDATLYDVWGNQIEWDSSGNYTPVADGMYMLKVKGSYSGETFTIRQSATGASMEQAYAASDDITYLGTGSSYTLPVGRFAYFKMTLKQGTNYLLGYTSETQSKASYMSVYDQNGYSVNSYSSTYGQSMNFVASYSGVYYVSLNNTNEVGNFTLMVAPTGFGRQAGTIDHQGQDGTSFYTLYGVDLRPNATYTFERADGSQSGVHLLNGLGQELPWDSNGNFTSSKADNYFVKVDGQSLGETFAIRQSADGQAQERAYLAVDDLAQAGPHHLYTVSANATVYFALHLRQGVQYALGYWSSTNATAQQMGVYAADGSAIPNNVVYNSSTMSITPPKDGLYFLRLSNNGQTGTYTVAAAPIKYGTQITGTIDHEDPVTHAYYALYGVDLKAGATFAFDRQDDNTSSVTVYDGLGQEVSWDSDGNLTRSTSGMYFVRVAGSNLGETFAIRQAATGMSLELAYAVVEDTKYLGAGSFYSIPAHNSRIFTVTLTAGNAYTIGYASLHNNTIENLQILNSSGSAIDSNKNSLPYIDFTAPYSGKYYILVLGQNYVSDSFNVMVGPAVYGLDITGTINHYDQATNSSYAAYGVGLRYNSTYSFIRKDGKRERTHIYNGLGEEIPWDADGGLTKESAGMYFLKVDGEHVGDTFAIDQAADGTSFERAYRAVQDSTFLDTSRFYTVYGSGNFAAELQEGGAYNITFDTPDSVPKSLYVYDQNGNNVAEKFYPDPMSPINFMASYTGRYYISLSVLNVNYVHSAKYTVIASNYLSRGREYPVQTHFGESGVQAASGNYSRSFTDLTVPSPGFSMDFSRTYNSQDQRTNTLLGTGWTFGFESSIRDYVAQVTYTDQTVGSYAIPDTKVVRLPDGSVQTFSLINGSYTALDSRSTLVKNANGSFELTTKDQVTYFFNANGYLVNMQDRRGNSVTLQVDSYGKITSVTDAVNRSYTMAYDANGHIRTITDPAHRVITYEYTDNRLTGVVDASGKRSSYAYDPAGYLTEIHNKDTSVVESVAYNHNPGPNQHKVDHITDVFGNVRIYSYSNDTGQTTITDSSGKQTIKAYDNRFNTTTAVDPDGKPTTVEYFKENDGTNRYREEKSVTDRNGNTTRFERDDRGNVLKQIHPDQSYTSFTYDDKNHVTSQRDESGHYTFYVYDAEQRNLLKKAQPLNGTDVYVPGTSDDVLFAITRYSYYTDAESLVLGYKAHGLLKSVTDPEQHTTTYTYDAYGNIATITDPLNHTVTYSYDTVGNKLTTVTAEGFQTQLVYDANNRVEQQMLHGGEVTRTIYDAEGRVVQQVAADQYDPVWDQPAQHQYAGNQGTRNTYYEDGSLHTVTDAENHMTTFTYDAYGNVQTETKDNGAVYVYTYDAINRCVSTSFKEYAEAPAVLLEEDSYGVLANGNTTKTVKTYINGTDSVTTMFTYDYAGRQISQTRADGSTLTDTYNPNGTKATSTDANGKTTVYQYDALGRLTAQWSPFQSTSSTVLYTYQGFVYDKVGRKLQGQSGIDPVLLHQLPSQMRTVFYTYDANDQVLAVADDEGPKLNYAYDADGHLSREERVVDAQHSNVTEWSYNYFDKPVQQKVYVRKGDLAGNDFEDNSEVVLVTEFTYDKNGNATTIKTPDNVATTTAYDHLNRAISVSRPGTDEFGSPVAWINSTTYDFAGHPLTQTDANGNTTTNRYTQRGFLSTVADAAGGTQAFYYDLLGRKVAQVSAQSFDAAKPLEQMNRTEYVYDVMGRVKTAAETYYDADSAQWVTYVSEAYAYDSNGHVVKKLDALGYAAGSGDDVDSKIHTGYGLETSYNDSGLAVSELDPVSKDNGLAYTRRYTYDALGRKTSETNAAGVITSYTYNDVGQVTNTKIQSDSLSPEQLIETNVFDRAGNLLVRTDGNGITTTWEYNAFRQVRQQFEPGDSSIVANTTRFQYDVMGRAVRRHNSLDNVQLMTYDHEGRLLLQTEQTLDGSDSITTLAQYDKNGNQRFETDGNGITTERVYDSLNRVLSQSITVNGVPQTTVYGYDKNGNKTSESNWLGNTYTYVYDPLNRMVEQKDPYNKTIQKLVYNRNHAQIRAYDADGYAAAAPYFTEYAYDKNNRLISTTDPDLHTTSQTYDALGNVVTKTDANGQQTRFTFDERNRLQTVVNANMETTSFTYDGNGNKLSQTDGKGNTTLFEYNVANRLLRRVDAGGRSGGPGAYSYESGKTESYTYYADGSLQSKLDRNGQTTAYTYDVHGREISEVTGNLSLTYSYDHNGNQLTITDETGTTTRTYDERNRATSKTVLGVGTTLFQYDLTTGLAAGTYAETSLDPKNNLTTKVYDRADRLGQVVVDGQATTYQYNDNGSRRSITYADGASEVYTYDRDHLVQTLVNRKADGTVIDSYSYTYDAQHNLLSKTDAMGTTAYTYDGLNRLLSATEPSGVLTSYTYDAAGNRSSETVVAGAETTVNAYFYDERSRLLRIESQVDGVLQQTTGYTYDSNGNQLTTAVDGTVTATNTYDLRNQLMATETDGTTVVNIYNGEGLRVAKTVNGTSTVYVYEYDHVVLELDQNGDQQARNVYGTNLLVRHVDGASYYYMYNGHADVTALLNAATGAIDATYYYDAFGVLVPAGTTGSVANSITYAGYQYDQETGLYYLNARMYDPKLARFMQEDTYRGDPNDPLSLNLYTYVSNNPLVYVDPTGHRPQWLDHAMNAVGSAVSHTASYVGDKISDSASYVGEKTSAAWNYTVDAVSSGYNYASNQVAGASSYVSNQASTALDATKSAVSSTYSYAKQGVAVGLQWVQKPFETVSTGIADAYAGANNLLGTRTIQGFEGPVTISPSRSPNLKQDLWDIWSQTYESRPVSSEAWHGALPNLGKVYGTTTDYVDVIDVGIQTLTPVGSVDALSFASKAVKRVVQRTVVEDASQLLSSTKNVKGGPGINSPIDEFDDSWIYAEAASSQVSQGMQQGYRLKLDLQTFAGGKGAGNGKSIPGQGYHNETYAPRPVKPQDATDKWNEFLGPGEHTNIHPRTGQPDPNRIVSTDGTRSIRYGDHEMNSSPTKHHYHEETWTYDPVNDVMNVDNSVVRVPNPKR